MNQPMANLTTDEIQKILLKGSDEIQKKTFTCIEPEIRQVFKNLNINRSRSYDVKMSVIPKTKIERVLSAMDALNEMREQLDSDNIDDYEAFINNFQTAYSDDIDHYLRWIITSYEMLYENACDKTCETLSFNKKISKGIELVDTIQKMKTIYGDENE